MTYDELVSLFQTQCKTLLSGTLSNVEKFIRVEYPVNGSPDWLVTDDIVFLFLSEDSDEYGKYAESQYKTEDGTVNAYLVRTRVWDLRITTYGPNSHTICNKIRDGFRLESTTRTLNQSSVFLIPDWPRCIPNYEQWQGRWWHRLDMTLRFNEAYTESAEDVGHIDTASIRLVGQRRTK